MNLAKGAEETMQERDTRADEGRTPGRSLRPGPPLHPIINSMEDKTEAMEEDPPTEKTPEVEEKHKEPK